MSVSVFFLVTRGEKNGSRLVEKNLAFRKQSDMQIKTIADDLKMQASTTLSSLQISEKLENDFDWII
jgi:hypothetical protein